MLSFVAALVTIVTELTMEIQLLFIMAVIIITELMVESSVTTQKTMGGLALHLPLCNRMTATMGGLALPLPLCNRTTATMGGLALHLPREMSRQTKLHSTVRMRAHMGSLALHLPLMEIEFLRYRKKEKRIGSYQVLMSKHFFLH